MITLASFTFSDLEPEISENSEAVKDPFSEEGSSKKRVVPLNLSKENIAIVEAALEQQKIYDIYFTSNLINYYFLAKDYQNLESGLRYIKLSFYFQPLLLFRLLCWHRLSLELVFVTTGKYIVTIKTFALVMSWRCYITSK